MPESSMASENRYLIALMGIDKKIDIQLNNKQSYITNPFPEVGGILFDVENKKLLSKHYRSREEVMKNI